MVPIRYTTYSACKLSLGMVFLVAALGCFFLALIVLGLPSYPLLGSASLDPAFSFAGEAFQQVPESLALLGIGVCFLLVLAGFGYRCLSIESETGSGGTLLRLMRRFRAFAVCLPVLRDSNPPISPASDSLLSALSSSRMFAPCAASVSGASPQLE